jgi:hypothetical protein
VVDAQCIDWQVPSVSLEGGGHWKAGSALTCGGACGCSGESALGAVEEATVEAEKHGDRSELLTALVAESRVMLEQAKTEQAERARAAAAAAEAAAAAAAAERLQMEEEMAALALSVQSDTLRMQSDALRVQSNALRLQQMQARLGRSVVAPPATPNPGTEETQCVVCMDAPKDHLIVPCGHMCVCAGCAEQLTKTRTPTCPVCREPIQQTVKVFCS